MWGSCVWYPMKLLSCLPVLLTGWLIQGAMAQERKLPEFDVATIKPIDSNGRVFTNLDVHPGGRVVFSGMSLKALMLIAFQKSYWQVSGGESWIDKEYFNVEAKPAENAGITNLRHSLFAIEDARLREMLQALLIDRFQLKFHREMKTGDVYVLTRTSKPLALRPVDAPAPDADPNRSSFGGIGYAGAKWVFTNTDMPGLAKFASDNILRASVRDETGLTGSFNYRQAVPDQDPNYSDNTDSFLRQISEVGLKLERSRGPVEMLVIDGAAKPSGN
jgi:uncharacterized protein (TIGR03435 family)